MANFARANLPTLKKTASYCLVHITVAAGVACGASNCRTGNCTHRNRRCLSPGMRPAFAYK